LGYGFISISERNTGYHRISLLISSGIPKQYLKRVPYFPVSYCENMVIDEHKYQKHTIRIIVLLISIKLNFAIGSNPLCSAKKNTKNIHDSNSEEDNFDCLIIDLRVPIFISLCFGTGTVIVVVPTFFCITI
jgi:hypothetical protein